MDSRVRRFDAALALAAALAFFASPGHALAQERVPAFWFQGTRLILERPVAQGGDVAVSTRDAGLHRFLDRLGATLAYEPQSRYVVVTAQDRRTVVFTVGDTAYTVGGVRGRAAFAPSADAGGDVTLPFLALARARYVEPVPDGAEVVLQPRVGGLDVRSDGARTTVTIRAAMPLIAATTADGAERLQITFVGQGSSLAPARRAQGALEGIDVAAGGSARVPTTTLTLTGAPGSVHRVVPGGAADAYSVTFEPRGAVAQIAPPNAPPTPPPPGPSAKPYDPATAPSAAAATPAPLIVAGRATVTDLAVEQGADDALTVRVSLSSAAPYEWHRLQDHRWYLDFANTTLNGPGRDERPSFGAVQAVRVRQTGTGDAPAVRIAFTLASDQAVDVQPTDTGVTITVTNAPAIDVARTGTGRAGGPAQPASAVAAPDPQPSDGGWKFGAAANPRLIVLDPGHGGPDTGTAHNGLVEKTLTLDIAQRLRTLLVAQGWQVRMTREGDVDPVSPDNLAKMRADGKPNADDRAYLQTRCDVANNAGARMFISIHINSAPFSGARGSTFYWYKPQDAALAQALERSVTASAGTVDDGARHENFYVVRHAAMPAVLIETAFVTNPGDVELLRSASFLQNVAQGIANGVKAYAGAPGSSTVSKQ